MKKLFTALMLGSILAACNPQAGIDGTSSESSSTASSSIASLPAETFTINQESGVFHGTVYVRGYVSVEKVNEPFCEENCTQHDYAFFRVTESGNQEFMNFLAENSDNSFASGNRVGLGCVEGNMISYFNHSDQYDMREFELDQETSRAILESTADQPVTLTLTKLPLSTGMGAPACYSHLTTIELGADEAAS